MQATLPAMMFGSFFADWAVSRVAVYSLAWAAWHEVHLSFAALWWQA